MCIIGAIKFNYRLIRLIDYKCEFIRKFVTVFNNTIDMNEEMIGTLAGKIWAVLSEQPMTVKELKTITKLKEAEIYAAIGWLSREGKMTVTPKGKDFVYSLN